MQYDERQRRRISSEGAGKTVASLDWEPDQGGYWVMTFTDGSEISFRFMAELARPLRGCPGGDEAVVGEHVPGASPGAVAVTQVCHAGTRRRGGSLRGLRGRSGPGGRRSLSGGQERGGGGRPGC
jgi:hypothetical protein